MRSGMMLHNTTCRNEYYMSEVDYGPFVTFDLFIPSSSSIFPFHQISTAKSVRAQSEAVANTHTHTVTFLVSGPIVLVKANVYAALSHTILSILSCLDLTKPLCTNCTISQFDDLTCLPLSSTPSCTSGTDRNNTNCEPGLISPHR